jgi:hypothetical protein
MGALSSSASTTGRHIGGLLHEATQRQLRHVRNIVATLS